MKAIRLLLSLAVTLALIYFLHTSQTIGTSTLPPLGKFMSPFQGFWSNSESNELNWAKDVQLTDLKDTVEVYYDERRVPHIIANNNYDLYFMQGYVQARDRLWQMDFITRVAAGRLSEVFGDKALNIDRTIRRNGIPHAASKTVEQMDTDPEIKEVMQAFSDGFNAYLKQLSYADYPVEYKLLNYKPEPWEPYKSALLLKFMSNNLSGKDYDFEYTNALNWLGKDVFNELFPDYAPGIDPIIPKGTPYPFDVAGIDTHAVEIPDGWFTKSSFDADRAENIGSNNWAVAGNRTNTGSPMLSSDPHLQLNLPSIWYEMQLTSPDINVYGATLPGSPCIIIGFNDEVAWGVTNAGRDVRDWYTINYTDDTRSAYLFDGANKPVEYVVETIKVKGQPDLLDTVRYTHFGPITYDREFDKYENPMPVALRWTAHDPSNELRTFYLLNKAANYDDYLAALDYYECPAQNFVFASQQGDIAIKQQGKFPLKYPDQGKFILDGSSSKYQWQGYIPYEFNAHHKNPERGFVSSANQQPTDSTYPFYYTGYYEYNRSRRINEVLAADSQITVQDLMNLHDDNFYYTAADILPTILDSINTRQLSEKEKEVFNILQSWDYMYNPDEGAPIIFEVLWEKLHELVWDEFEAKAESGIKKPNDYITTLILRDTLASPFIDIAATPIVETKTDLYEMAFEEGADAYLKWRQDHNSTAKWWEYKNTTITHWVPLLTPFHRDKVKIGGNKHIVNATSSSHGASWRMVVSLEKPVKAWAAFPGGQSGNPGSPYYDNFIDTWAAGNYYPLKFIHKNTKPQNFSFSQTFHN